MRAFTVDRPHRWAEWLSLAKYWFNSNFHTSLKLTPFEALYGFPPSTLQSYIPSTTRVDALDSLLCQRVVVLATLKGHLVAAQEKMKFQVDKHRQDRSFNVGDWVYLRHSLIGRRLWLIKGSGRCLQGFLDLFRFYRKLGLCLIS